MQALEKIIEIPFFEHVVKIDVTDIEIELFQEMGDFKKYALEKNLNGFEVLLKADKLFKEVVGEEEYNTITSGKKKSVKLINMMLQFLEKVGAEATNYYESLAKKST